jgi:hypothetical protein
MEEGRGLFAGTCAGFEVLTAVVMKSFICWDTAPYSPLKVDRRFGETYGLHSGFFFYPEDGGDMFLRNVG